MAQHPHPETASSHELKRYKQDKVIGLKIFMEARLLNDTFMDNHTQDEVKAMARQFDKKRQADFETIWEETVTLTNMVRYGEEWDRLTRSVHFENRHEALRFYFEILLMNRLLSQEFADDLYYAGLIYNAEYLYPPLDVDSFGRVWYAAETGTQYLKGNKLAPCFCDQHKDSEMSKLYGAEVQKKVALDFIESDICKGVDMLHYLESLLENKINSIAQVRKAVLEYAADIGLDYNKLDQIWDIAIDRASEDVQKKVVIDISSHGKNTCEWPGCTCSDINQLELYTRDDRLVKDLAEDELDKYHKEQDQIAKETNQIGSV